MGMAAALSYDGPPSDFQANCTRKSSKQERHTQRYLSAVAHPST